MFHHSIRFLISLQGNAYLEFEIQESDLYLLGVNFDKRSIFYLFLDECGEQFRHLVHPLYALICELFQMLETNRLLYLLITLR